jgi:hypothetical protein
LQIFSTPGKFVAKTLGLRKGTNSFAYVHLYTALWLTSWFVFVYSPWLSPMVAGGLMEESLNLRVSFIMGALKGQWNQAWFRTMFMATTDVSSGNNFLLPPSSAFQYRRLEQGKSLCGYGMLLTGCLYSEADSGWRASMLHMAGNCRKFWLRGAAHS